MGWGCGRILPSWQALPGQPVGLKSYSCGWSKGICYARHCPNSVYETFHANECTLVPLVVSVISDPAAA